MTGAGVAIALVAVTAPWWVARIATEQGAELGWLQVASSCGFAGLAWWLIVRTGPGVLRDFRDDLAAEREARQAQGDAFVAAIRTEREAYDRNLERVLSGVERQMADTRVLVHEVIDRMRGEARDPDPKAKG